MKKKKVATILEYEQHKSSEGINPWTIQQIFGKNAVHGVARFVSCNRDKVPKEKVEILELHGNLIGPIVQSVGSNSWEILECEVIIIPRRRLQKPKGRMSSMTAQQIYLGSDILSKMEKSYLICSDPDTTSSGNEEIEIIKV